MIIPAARSIHIIPAAILVPLPRFLLKSTISYPPITSMFFYYDLLTFPLQISLIGQISHLGLPEMQIFLPNNITCIL